MKIRTGLDSVEISRMEHAMEKQSFQKHVFSGDELSYYESKGMRAESLAGAWCAKEAFGKLTGHGISGFGMNEVEVLHDEYGKPYYRLSGAATALADSLKIRSLDLSITHDRTYASAVAVALTEE